ncbi:MAG TPA: hypothetical protein VKU87_03780 [Thermomicrobiaceae bacterium]|nr:hypothetical protein [Thermomicrobiaceae bacterium]
MADQPKTVDPNQQTEGQSAATPAPIDQANPPAPTGKPHRQPLDPSVFGGASYEEIRKGVRPETPISIDGRAFDDRFTSELMMVNLPGGRWTPVRPIFIPE